MRTLLLALIVMLSGCGHVPKAPAVGGVVAADTFAEAYARVAGGREPTARADGWMITRSKETIVRVMREEGMGGLDNVPDATLTRRVRAALGDKDIAVRADAGVVTLKGEVGATDVQRVLDVKGVVAVSADSKGK
jgi:hypothetical protein